jgi:outer membrane protein OmpA-like peptidoglycan-associated protein
MCRHRIIVVLVIIGIGFALVWPLRAQSREGLTDFRGQTYSVDDLEKALFPDAQPPARLRGIAPEQPTAIVPVLFEFNSDRILPKYYSDLDKVGQVLTRRPNAQFRIEGHTDSIGSDAYNLSLSRRRAESVKQYLMRQFSIAGDRLTVLAKGKSDPIASNDTSEGRDKNRRVAFVNLGN